MIRVSIGCACADKDDLNAVLSKLLGPYAASMSYGDLKAGKFAKQLGKARYVVINGTGAWINDSVISGLPGGSWQGVTDGRVPLMVLRSSSRPTLTDVDQRNQSR